MSTIFIIFQIIILLWFGYWFVIGLFGFGKAKPSIYQPPRNRFLILIPANNEEEVIEDLLINLKQLDYPKELYDICLIADNCSDSTAQIGYNQNVIVLEHFYQKGELKGKPYAIKYAIDNIDLRQYDALCVFDADNLVSLNYLTEMNNHLCSGDRLIQCYLDTKNPKDNFITLSYATSYYIMNRSWQLAKSRLGLGNAIGGTGFCVERELFEQIGWTARSLTEDLEFTMQALLIGVKASWCHYAKVYDEKPTSFIASVHQRVRWSNGHWDVCFNYVPRLLYRGIIKKDMSCIDGALYLMNPGKVVIGTAVSILFYLTLFSGSPLYQPFIPMWIYFIIIFFNVTYISISLRDGKANIHPIKAYISLLFISYTYIPIFFWSLFNFRSKYWNKTKHTKSVSLTQIEDKIIS